MGWYNTKAAKMKILIVGAGIGGLTLAHWLHQAGHTPIVVEKADSIRTEGYIIDFTGTGWDVANRMGLIPALQKVQQPIDAIIAKNRDGQTVAHVPIRDLFRAAEVDGKYMALNRRDIVAVLYEHVRDDVEVRFGVTVTQICQTVNDVTVTLTDGTSQSYDLMVGADGIHSRVRQLTFGSEAASAHYLGYHFAVFTIPGLPRFVDAAYHMLFEPNIQAGIYPLASGEWLIFAVYRHADSVVPAPAQRIRHLRDKLAGIGWLMPDILRQLTDDSQVFMDTVTQIQMPRWFQNRVVLLGDAAYCPTLISGQGASMAMAGAYFLAEALKNNPLLEQVLPAYEQRLSGHLHAIQRRAANFAPNFVPSSRWRIQLVTLAMRLMGNPLVGKLVGKQFTAKSIL
jgi:2-polyprenyl-6-methoxyphenol hydroxylase-like FAD-dependent oxidoreductase